MPEPEYVSECIGGPLDGTRHGWGGHWIGTIHLARGRWAVYVTYRDMRARFAGYATSKAKARAMAREFRKSMRTRHA